MFLKEKRTDRVLERACLGFFGRVIGGEGGWWWEGGLGDNKPA